MKTDYAHFYNRFFFIKKKYMIRNEQSAIIFKLIVEYNMWKI